MMGNNPSDFIRLFIHHFLGTVEDGLFVSDSLCTAAPSSRKKIGELMAVGEGSIVHRLVSRVSLISSSSVKTANNEM